MSIRTTNRLAKKITRIPRKKLTQIFLPVFQLSFFQRLDVKVRSLDALFKDPTLWYLQLRIFKSRFLNRRKNRGKTLDYDLRLVVRDQGRPPAGSHTVTTRSKNRSISVSTWLNNVSLNRQEGRTIRNWSMKVKMVRNGELTKCCI